MKFNAGQINKAKKAQNAEELFEMAKAENIELSLEEAKGYFNKLNGNQELSDEELSVVAGGKEDDPYDGHPAPLYNSTCQWKDGNYTIYIDGAPSWQNDEWYYPITKAGPYGAVKATRSEKWFNDYERIQ